MYTLFLYTGYGLDSFRANVPDNPIIFVQGDLISARRQFLNKVGKEPDLMGYQHVEGSSKEVAWQKALDGDFGLGDVELDSALQLALVIDDTETSKEDV